MKLRLFVLRPNRIMLALLAAALTAALPARADVRLPRVFSDNMMLQRDMPVHVWGWAEPGEAVSAALAGSDASTKADVHGEWSLELPALKDGENLELLVSGKNSLTLKNIIVGDIWVCSGQSNMEMTLGGCLGAAEDIQGAELPKIRRIRVEKVQSGQPESDLPTPNQWQVCSPQTAGGFTAVGFYFAREIQQQTGVPIGIIDSNWGGSRIEPWTTPQGVAMIPELKADSDGIAAAGKAYRDGLLTKLGSLERWIVRTRAELDKGEPVSPAPGMPVPPVRGWSGMYNAMIHPLAKFPIKGALWYQGESNGGEGQTYYNKMHALVGGWRKAWGQGDFPFHWVQLANFQNPIEDPAGGNGWAKLREAQTLALDLPHSGMAVITDTVPLTEAGDIHPKNKYDVGYRLARWSLGQDYGKTEHAYSGPLFKAIEIAGGKARVEFEHTGAGLMIGKKEGRNPAVEDAEGKLKRFAVAGADQKWHWADAVIENNAVVVSSPEVPEPVAVRYAFEMNPDGANLYNKDGLPAGPFRSDDW
ncbi:MAG: sialate O-acetylesterase [Verrucomicrobiales bacterium]|jgi:sialate O-acetylesterase